MYDMVTKKYHYNMGTGTLTAGNKINFIDYIESDGNSYINTDVFADNTYTFDTTVAFVKENYNCVPWGVRSSGNYSTANSQCYLNTNTLNNTSPVIKLFSTNTGLATNWSSGIIPEIDKVYELKGMTVVSTMTTMEYPIILFGLNNIGAINTSVGVCRIYKWTAYSNGVVIQDLRPCVVAGEACFYDMVTGKVFTNAGTGTLKANGRFVESIVFDGESWIDTGFKPNPATTRAILENVFLDNTEIQAVFGSRPATTCGAGSCNIWYNIALAVLDPGTSRLDWTGFTHTAKVPINQRNIIDCLGNTVTINGKKYQGTTVKTNAYIGYSIYLGNHNSVGTVYQNSCKMRVYSFQIYDNGTLVRDLRPYVDEHGTACFKDIVTGNLFYNKGTGTLGYTEE
jgi:hypothetical protein